MEREVWVDFYKKELIARTAYATYATLKDKLYEIEAGIETIQAKRLEKINSGIEEATGFRITDNRRFAPDAQLQIMLRVATASAPGDVDLGLAVGGVRLTPAVRRAAPPGEVELFYSVDARTLDSGTDGLLTLEVRRGGVGPSASATLERTAVDLPRRPPVLSPSTARSASW